MPVPAVAGSNTPEPLTPGPLQVPPGVTGINVKGASVVQNGPAGQTVASQQNKTIGTQADIFIDCTYPVLEVLEELPVAPHTITSPP